MKKFKVLIAEDTIEAREILIEELNNLKNKSDIDFEITECEFPDKALSKISEAGNNNNYFHILFIDIDFTEQSHKGGKRDSGFQIIERAFETCPISKICTYSGQFQALDLSEKHQELIKKGLVVYTFDKSRRDAGMQDWFEKGMNEIIDELKKQYYLFDIFTNHKRIKEIIGKGDLPFEIKWEIFINLDTVLNLMRDLIKISSEYIYYRLIIHLYHLSLLTYLKNTKSKEDLERDFNLNKDKAEEIIKPSRAFTWQEQNALSIIVAESPAEFVRYGYKLNNYRNKSIHPDEDFKPDLYNIIFSSLVFTLYVVKDKSQISTELIRDFASQLDKEAKGKNDFDELIKFINS